MTQKTKKILIGSAALVAMVVLCNLLPASVCTAATIYAGVGAVAGWFANTWYDQNVESTE